MWQLILALLVILLSVWNFTYNELLRNLDYERHKQAMEYAAQTWNCPRDLICLSAGPLPAEEEPAPDKTVSKGLVAVPPPEKIP